MPLLIVLSFLLGLAIGSFLNVFTFRYQTGRSLTGRSRCLACNHNLAWYDLLPVISYILILGRCRHCKSVISLQYPVVEFLTGIVFSLLAWKFFLNGISVYELLQFGINIVFWSLIIAISVYDMRHRIIPDRLVLAAGIISLLWIFTQSHYLPHSLLAGLFLSSPFFLIWLFSQGRAMGLGDSKFALPLGFMLGPANTFSDILSVILLSFWIGGALSLYLILVKPRQYSLKSEIPFGPFLALAAFGVFIFDINIVEIFGWNVLFE